jgi:hypothetical protein
MCMFWNTNELTKNCGGVDKNNTLDEIIVVINNKLYSLRSFLALTSFSVDAESNANNKPQTAMQTPNGIFIVLRTIQLFIKYITVRNSLCEYWS